MVLCSNWMAFVVKTWQPCIGDIDTGCTVCLCGNPLFLKCRGKITVFISFLFKVWYFMSINLHTIYIVEIL